MPRPRGSIKTPKLTHHKTSGRAVVRLSGVDHYCGAWGTKVAQREYDRAVGEWLANGRTSTAPATPLNSQGLTGPTVSTIAAAFWQHAQGYYKKPDGTPTSEVDTIRQALRPLRRLYGPTPAAEFGPRALKALRLEMMKPREERDPTTGSVTTRPGWCRTFINRQTARIKLVFKWAVENELLPPHVHHGLSAVGGLRKGRSEARESDPVKPAPDHAVDAILPVVSRQVSAMVELQLLSGARPGEIVIMRTCDIDTTGPVWVYRPHQHKGVHHELDREIRLGPKAQAVVGPFLRTNVQEFLFNPAEAEAERLAALHATRKTPMNQGNKPGTNRARAPKRKPSDRYTVASYRRAIARACDRADVPRFHPHQLRHNAATFLRRTYGIEVARVVLGHRSAAITEVYAEVDMQKAEKVMAEVG